MQLLLCSCFFPSLTPLNHYAGCYSAHFSFGYLEHIYFSRMFFPFEVTELLLLCPFPTLKDRACTLAFPLICPQMSFSKVTANVCETVSGNFSHMSDRCSSGSAKLARHHSKYCPKNSFRLYIF